MKKAHEISSRLENAIKDKYPDVKKIEIHEEPE
jgi:divalent metal cation (Fe/Co/Zn/Cd) transporter